MQRPLRLTREAFHESIREASFSDGEHIIGRVSAPHVGRVSRYEHNINSPAHCLPGDAGGSQPTDCCDQTRDPVTPGRNLVPRAQEFLTGVSDDPER